MTEKTRTNMRPSNVVVLHSGGQDSTTCLAWAIDTWGKNAIYPLLFNYDQRHQVEMQQALVCAELLGVRSPRILPVEALSLLGGAALTDDSIEPAVDAAEVTDGGMNRYAVVHGLPSTFVPGRNLLFFTLAAAYGATIGSNTFVTGVCQTDRAGYPDCRGEFVDAAERAISLALDQQTHVIAPLLRRSKADTWALAKDLGVLDIIKEHTHTCYHGDREHRHPWGYGCGECGACVERASGFNLFVASNLEAKLP